MRVDISQILSQKGASLPFQLSVNIENIEDYPNVVDFLAPVIIEGTITNIDSEYVASGVGHTKICMSCDSCLAPVEVNVHFNLDQVFSNTGSADEEIETFSGDNIDLSETIRKHIIFSLPMKVSCNDGCKGLCPKCGKDLNEGDCNCDTAYIDPRFESLRSLFNVDEEV